MSWIIEDKGFNPKSLELNGNKFMLGNGYMGYRGTMEEYSKDQLTACVLSGVYDQVKGKWREPVNVPNGLYFRLYCDGEPCDVLSSESIFHQQSLDIKKAVHKRKTVFKLKGKKTVELNTERFLSAENVHLMCIKYSFICSEPSQIFIKTGFDLNVWDINGPHLENKKCFINEDVIALESTTQELKLRVCQAEAIETNFQREESKNRNTNMREISFKAQGGKEYTIIKYVSVYTSIDNTEDPMKAALLLSKNALCHGYEKLIKEHIEVWNEKWEISDVEIKGDEEAQLGLRYSIYQLLAIAPMHSEKVSIPARGLSGQVYKGAIFWDTEMFMLPFFNFTDPKIARNLVMYRFHTLDGARRKAEEYGFRGAFYSWESQDTGDDACTLFNVTDVFTKRPMRTYFRDKQIHISADVAYGIWQYYSITGDESILLDGGAEVILECARFFYSYAYFKYDKQRFEILDVTGPDEYHERVNNNAFTNSMIRYTLQVAVLSLEILKTRHEQIYSELMEKLNYYEEIDNIKNMLRSLYIPKPNNETDVIQQFDGYDKLEDISLDELKKRVINPHEYWGGGNGIAVTTKILKQADTVLMLNLFRNEYPYDVKKANWEYYEPRTEHGSSLSACIYAMLAADINNTEWAYKYFMKTATIDLTGDSKQYVGNLYIGGTHPAANGGAWMAAIFGFAGLSIKDDTIFIHPHLPQKWEGISFKFMFRRMLFKADITENSIKIQCDSKKFESQKFKIAETDFILTDDNRSLEISY